MTRTEPTPREATAEKIEVVLRDMGHRERAWDEFSGYAWDGPADECRIDLHDEGATFRFGVDDDNRVTIGWTLYRRTSWSRATAKRREAEYREAFAAAGLTTA